MPELNQHAMRTGVMIGHIAGCDRQGRPAERSDR